MGCTSLPEHTSKLPHNFLRCAVQCGTNGGLVAFFGKVYYGLHVPVSILAQTRMAVARRSHCEHKEKNRVHFCWKYSSDILTTGMHIPYIAAYSSAQSIGLIFPNFKKYIDFWKDWLIGSNILYLLAVLLLESFLQVARIVPSQFSDCCELARAIERSNAIILFLPYLLA